MMLNQPNQLRRILPGLLAIGFLSFQASFVLLQAEETVQVKKIEVQPRYVLGVSVANQPISKQMRTQIPELKERGLLVQFIGDKTPASEAGIQRYDILLTANKKPLKELADLHTIVNNAGKEKQEITLELLRAGKKLTAKVTPMLSKDILKGMRPTKIREENIAIPQLGKLFPKMFSSGTMIIESADGDGTRITITKTNGARVSKIVVTKNGEPAWKGTDTEIDKAPKEYQEKIRTALSLAKRGAVTQGKGMNRVTTQNRTKGGGSGSGSTSGGASSSFSKGDKNSETKSETKSESSGEFSINGMKIQLHRKNAAPVTIKVIQGDNSWQAIEKELDSLPAEVKQAVKKALGTFKKNSGQGSGNFSTGKNININAGVEVIDLQKILNTHKAAMKQVHRPIAGTDTSRLEKQVSELQKQIEALSKAVEKMNKQLENKK